MSSCSQRSTRVRARGASFRVGVGARMGANAGGRANAVAFVLVCALALAGCAANPPRVDGVRATSPSAAIPWTPPPSALPKAVAAKPAAELPPALLDSLRNWTLMDVVDIALRNNPETQAAWAQARASAAAFGSKRGAYYPQVDVGAIWIDQKGTTSGGRVPFTQKYYSPTANLNWLLFDFGGREADIDEARQALFGADWLHNATIQNVILEVEEAYYEYVGDKVLLTSAQATVKEAQSSLDAAQDRHSAGLATIADVLQAKTALSQAELDLETFQGRVATARGGLATSMGLSANTSFDVELPEAEPPLQPVADTVEHALEIAAASRPDLAAAQAAAREADAHRRKVRAEGYPAIVANGTASRLYYESPYHTSDTYIASLGVRMPIFTGFSHTYDVREASAQADAARARLQGTEQVVVLQVWTSYYDLKTAEQRVRTSADLMASATQSHDVALDRYRQGVGTILDLLSAQTALEGARAQQVQARSDWYVALAQLAHATGKLTPASKGEQR